jgi:LmbE family N-acetylglucosaminyl deacetylase
MADVLCIVAHPDDESLFAGGTLARMAKAGSLVVVVALSDGVGSRFHGRQPANHRQAMKAREAQFHAALDALGSTGCVLDVFPDQGSDTVPQLAINRAVERQLANYDPQMVFTHHVGDLNIDHRRVSEAVLVATRGSSARVFSMAPEFPSRCVGPAWHPDVSFALDVGTEGDSPLDSKVAACLCYVDELREYPHPRSERAIREQRVERFLEIR